MHCTEIRPIFGDVDAMNIVYYANYLRFFEKGRAELMRAAGRPYLGLAEQGFHLPVTEARVRYLAPAYYDQLLVVQTTVAWVKRASLQFDYRILDGREPAAGLLVEGFTAHACVDGRGKPVGLPAQARQTLLSIKDSG